MAKGGADDALILRLIEAANEPRRSTRGQGDPTLAADAEAQLEQMFRHSQRLAMYGTLAPGRSNHHVVAPYDGTWTRGRVRGDFEEAGWGAAAGYPALRCRADGPWVPVHLLESLLLPGGWRAIDEFEGSEYRRVLVPVYAARGDRGALITVANLYEIAE